MALGEIVSSPDGRLTRDLVIQGQKRGNITVLAEEVSQNNDAVDFQLRANKLDKKDFFGKSDPYVNIYRANEGNTWTLVKRTEVIKNTLDPSWRPFEMSVDALCRGDYDRSLKFEVLDWNSDGSFDYIGEFCTSLREVSGFESAHAAVTTFDVINARKKEKKGSKYKNSGTFSFLKAAVRKRFSFLEYIHGGLDLNFTVAIDFTASNGNPQDPRSLHFRDQRAPNQYQQVHATDLPALSLMRQSLQWVREKVVCLSFLFRPFAPLATSFKIMTRTSSFLPWVLERVYPPMVAYHTISSSTSTLPTLTVSGLMASWRRIRFGTKGLQ